MIYAVVMAGGIGSRFWPVSTPQNPKQLLSFFRNRTMIQLTLDRLKPLLPSAQHRIVTIPDQVSLFQKKLSDFDDNNYIIEPSGKNTAPCIGLSAVNLLIQDEDAILVVLPADHLIQHEEKFLNCLETGIRCVQEKDALVTLGIRPTRPETGYGYIQYERDEVSSNLHRVVTFAEKPNRETAVRFIQTGEFLWNSGIFIWSARRILSEIEEYIPELYVSLMDIKDAIEQGDDPERIQRAYNNIKPISIDYGVMERSRHVYVVRGDFQWSDVGNWDEVYRLTEDKDSDGNVLKGNVVAEGCTNSYLYSEGKNPLAVVGIDNGIVVQTDQGTLVCSRDEVQNVKKAAEQIFRTNKP